MHRGVQGRYRKVRIPGAFDKHKAFLPAPLPPEPALRITKGSALFALNAQANDALAQTEAFWRSLKHRQALVSAFAYREAILTSMMDKSRVHLRELLYYRARTSIGRQAPVHPTVLDVNSYISATQFAHKSLKNRNAIELNLLLDAHKILVGSERIGDSRLDGEGVGDGRLDGKSDGGEGEGDGRLGGESKEGESVGGGRRGGENVGFKRIDGERARHKHPGQLRVQQNWRGTEMRLRNGRRLFDITYVPPPPKVVGAQMHQLLNFIGDDTVAISPLLRTGLAHAQFGNIHPFDDSSGRMNRMFISMMLTHYKLLSWPVLCLSEYLFGRWPLYYHLLNRIRLDGDWETWLEFFLTGIIESCDASRATALALNTLLEEDQTIIEDGSDALKRTRRALLNTGVASIEILARKARLTRNNTVDCLMQLCKLDIAAPIRRAGQEPLYCYRSYIEIIDVGLPEDYGSTE